MIELLAVNNKPTAHRIYNCLRNFQENLQIGKSLWQLSENMENMLKTDKISDSDTGKLINHFQDAFVVALENFDKHYKIQTKAIEFFKEVRVLDPRQKSSLGRNISSYPSIFGHEVNNDLLDEWCRYYNSHVDFENFDILNYWERKGDEYPLISKLALSNIWIPASSADVERSFSKLNLLETPFRSNMSDRNLIDSLFCYYNVKYVNF